MTEPLHAPMTPADCDLRDFGYIPLEIERLRRSNAWRAAKRKPELAFYMLNLWSGSFHEVPAASIEDDDEAQADLAQCDVKKWRRIKADVLHGWRRCTDGRLYHKVVAEKALEAWIEKLGQRKASAIGNANRWKTEFSPEKIDEAIVVAADMLRVISPQSKALTKKTVQTARVKSPEKLPVQSGTIPPAIPKASDRDPDAIPIEGKEKEKGNKTLLRSDADASKPGKAQNGSHPPEAPPEPPQPRGPAPPSKPADDATWLWQNGLRYLERTTGRSERSLRSMIGKWRRDAKENLRLLREIIEDAEREKVSDPLSFIAAAIPVRLAKEKPDGFQYTDDAGWRNRMRSFQRNQVWPPSWGGKAPGDDQRHPPHILAEFGYGTGELPLDKDPTSVSPAGKKPTRNPDVHP